jgi:hypothetical protein
MRLMLPQQSLRWKPKKDERQESYNQISSVAESTISWMSESFSICAANFSMYSHGNAARVPVLEQLPSSA